MTSLDGGGEHKNAPDIAARARRFATECGFAVACVDVPAHGDRPVDAELDRIAAENRARVDARAELAPLIAGFPAMVAGRTVPEWRAVLDGCSGSSARCNANPGRHGDLPPFELDRSARFFARHPG